MGAAKAARAKNEHSTITAFFMVGPLLLRDADEELAAADRGVRGLEAGRAGLRLMAVHVLAVLPDAVPGTATAADRRWRGRRPIHGSGDRGQGEQRAQQD